MPDVDHRPVTIEEILDNIAIPGEHDIIREILGDIVIHDGRGYSTKADVPSDAISHQHKLVEEDDTDHKPSKKTADEVILGELYWRFAQGTQDWHWRTNLTPILVAHGEGKQRRYEETTRVKEGEIIDISVYLKSCLKWAETFWLPDWLERRRKALEKQSLTGPARALTQKCIKPTMELAKFLFDHPYELPSFLDTDTALDAVSYHVLVWFHFALYPGLKDKFLAGVFPAVQDLPSTVLRVKPIKPTGEKTDPASGEGKPETPKSNDTTPKQTGATGTNISGMVWQDAKTEAEKYVGSNGFPGITKLAAIVGCVRNTMRRAIKASVMLRHAEEEYKNNKKKKTSPPATGLSDKIQATRESDSISPDEAADVKLLMKKKDADQLRTSIVKLSTELNTSVRKTDETVPILNEKECIGHLAQNTHEELAGMYISLREEVSEIHRDDPQKPGHTRQL